MYVKIEILEVIMCGIVGYIGQPRRAEEIVDILSLLEYRGYDSAGISGINDDGCKIIKEVGSISNLRKKIPQQWSVTNAIAHTRWATHGASTLQNAHPHQSLDKKWIIVHNGIIENYKELCSRISACANISPNSRGGGTDTQILIEYIANKNIDTFEDFVKLFQDIKGSYAIICQNTQKPNELYIAKKNSPLYIASDKDNNIFLASDPVCFSKYTNVYKTFNDNEFAHIHDQKIFIVDSELRPIIKESSKLKDDFVEQTKLDYAHFMLKEIYEQPDALRRQVDFYKEQKILSKFNSDFLSRFNQIKLVGCGTAYHACMIGVKYIENILSIPASAEIASEFVYNTNVFEPKRTLYIFVSQSGETADTIKALNIQKEKGATCIALTNVAYSTLSQQADYCLPICAGPEVSVASTKAYTCQLSALYLFANALKTNEDLEKAYNNIVELSTKLFDFNIETADKIAEYISSKRDAVFIGKNFDFVTAREGALKIKEITYVNANACPSGELKHGYLAIVEEGTPLVVVATDEELNSKVFNSSSEAVARGAVEIVISTDDHECKYLIKLKKINPLLMPMLSIVPIQYIAYKASILKGINPDKPRNLAKSVTVE